MCDVRCTISISLVCSLLACLSCVPRICRLWGWAGLHPTLIGVSRFCNGLSDSQSRPPALRFVGGGVGWLLMGKRLPVPQLSCWHPLASSESEPSRSAFRRRGQVRMSEFESLSLSLSLSPRVLESLSAAGRQAGRQAGRHKHWCVHRNHSLISGEVWDRQRETWKPKVQTEERCPSFGPRSHRLSQYRKLPPTTTDRTAL
jgi:hypothetical protein